MGVGVAVILGSNVGVGVAVLVLGTGVTVGEDSTSSAVPLLTAGTISAVGIGVALAVVASTAAVLAVADTSLDETGVFVDEVVVWPDNKALFASNVAVGLKVT
jgi:hypothetical protein